jgi:hypothetical protein
MNNRKSLIEMVLMPLVIALVGIGGTYLITAQQENSATTMKDAQLESTRELAEADRQVKILEIFAEKVASSDQQERILALRLLDALEPVLAEKLASAVVAAEPQESEVRKVADEVAQEANAKVRFLPRVYIHIRSDEDRERARAVAERLKELDYVMPGIERLVDKGPENSQLRFFRPDEEEEANRILGLLRKMGIELELKFIPGYQQSDAIGPGHFEIWFARGEPREISP